MMDCTDRHDRFFLRLMSKNVMLYTEMVATKSAIHGDRKKILSFSPEEKPLALQVGGSNKEELAEVAKIAEDMGYDEININLGCPSKKVQKNKFGACLMQEPDLVAKCIEAMSKATKLPVTIKTRIGYNEVEDFKFLKSFIQTTKDLLTAKKLIPSKFKVMVKVEKPSAMDEIESITENCDGIMVARGDLGIETDLSNLPNIQRKIMSNCAKHGVRSIVATHLLESMIENPTPTRAEVTDVANAIYEGADAVMLSGETTIGKYPVECVSFISRIASQTEKYRTLGYESKLISDTDWQHLGIAAKNIAESISADGIIAITRSGQTAEIVSNAKPFMIPIFAFSNNRKPLNQLSLAGSVNAYYSPMFVNHEKNVNSAMKAIKNVLKPQKDLKFVVISGILSETSADAIEIRYLKLD